MARLKEREMYVTDQAGLEELVERTRDASVVAVDTEFMRERTYWAKLCLIQIATPDLAAIIDPLAVKDLEPLRDLLTRSGAVKVFHAGSQDLEIFYRIYDEPVRPVFDTQVAATLAGFPQQMGYGALVKEMLDVTLDKGDTYTDWAKRPLSSTQIEYALNDVRYLPEMYRQLHSKLEREGRLEWLDRDFKALVSEDTYRVDPRELWRKLKRISGLNRRQMGVAREVVAWREHEAQRRDVPRRWVIGDETLVELARRMPSNFSELASVRGVSDKLPRAAYEAVLAAVSAGVTLSEDELPVFERRRRPSGDVDCAVDLMIALVRLRAKQRGVAMPLLASRDDLERLAAGERHKSPLLEGWRGELVGHELLELLEGKISLQVSGGSVRIVREQTQGE
jgi:ribonuclease D